MRGGTGSGARRAPAARLRADYRSLIGFLRGRCSSGRGLRFGGCLGLRLVLRDRQAGREGANVGDALAQHRRRNRRAVLRHRGAGLVGKATLHRHGVEHDVGGHVSNPANIEAGAGNAGAAGYQDQIGRHGLPHMRSAGTRGGPELMPEYASHRIYGAVAYLKAYQESDVRAERLGLFVIRATGSSASITNREEFTPRTFGHRSAAPSRQ